MFGKFSRGLLAVTATILVAGCNSSSPTEGLSLGSSSAASQQPVSPVVQAFCPPVVMLEQTATHRVYARGGDGNAEKLLYQASLADVTRQCTADQVTMTVNIVAQGRIVQGAAGTPGNVTLPMLVEVLDGDNVLSSQKMALPVSMPAGGTQFIFNTSDVRIPVATGGVSRFTRVRLGFDPGGPAKRPARRG